MLPNALPFFIRLPDPRRETRNKLHKVEDIVMITLCAVLVGVEDWVSIEDFGHANEAWLRRFLELPNGIPSHDTLSDIIGRINRDAFATAFTEWVRAGLATLAGHQVAIDGKSLRGSRSDDGMVHVISAFAKQARLVLAANAIPDKANEITDMPGLLAQLDLARAIVTIDAMGCQKNVAEAIVEQKADYVLALKENHPVETRRIVVSNDIDSLAQKARWSGLQALALVESRRRLGNRSVPSATTHLQQIEHPTPQDARQFRLGLPRSCALQK